MTRRTSAWSLVLLVLAGVQGCGDDSRASSTLGLVCGGESGRNCVAGEYCAYQPGQNCGRADATATCKERPDACPAIYAPVCGCDGKTYPSACDAAGSGVGYEREGPCDSGKMCAGIAGIQCPDGEVCVMNVGLCLVPDASGTCRQPPSACDTIYAPVCGCDGKTYGNACSAELEGVNVAKVGECG